MRTILIIILYVLINIAHELNPVEYYDASFFLEEGSLRFLVLIAIIGDLVNFFKNLSSK